MTKDFEPPNGPWARAIRTEEGVYGVMVGHGEMAAGFIPEPMIPAWIGAALKVADQDDLLAKVSNAAATLPEFKRALQRRQGEGARSN